MYKLKLACIAYTTWKSYDDMMKFYKIQKIFLVKTARVLL